MDGNDDLFSNSDDEFDLRKTEEQEKQTILVVSSSSDVNTPDNFGKNAEASKSNGPNLHEIEISITNHEKRGEGINGFIVYRVETKVSNLAGYTKNYFEVWRRFSDFLGLREKLASKYQHKGVVIPYAPEKSISALTKTKLNSGEENNLNELADKRARLLQRFLRRLASHPRILLDCDFRDFLCFEGILPKSDFTSILSGSNMKKMFKTMGELFSKFAFPMDENDRWFEQVHSQIDELDEILVRLHSQTHLLSSHRNDLASGGENLCKALSMLASCEENTALSRALSKLAETHENIALVQKDGSKCDSQVLEEEFYDQLQLINVIKEVFYERVKGWQNWQNQQQLLTRKRELKTRMDLAGKTERASQYKDELKEQENKTDQLEREFSAMSKNIRDEFSRYSAQRCSDIKINLVSYLESLLKNEQQTLDYWGKLESEIKNLS